ncbi:MAG: hypothetical protein HQL82_12900 [Magnetococcales bacterium]|nr:hypothetical protein [Magnetococcales bacterium]
MSRLDSDAQAAVRVLFESALPQAVRHHERIVEWIDVQAGDKPSALINLIQDGLGGTVAGSPAGDKPSALINLISLPGMAGVAALAALPDGRREELLALHGHDASAPALQQLLEHLRPPHGDAARDALIQAFPRAAGFGRSLVDATEAGTGRPDAPAFPDFTRDQVDRRILEQWLAAPAEHYPEGEKKYFAKISLIYAALVEQALGRGDLEEGLTIAREWVAFFRDKQQVDGKEVTEDLVLAMLTLSVFLTGLGRKKEALTISQDLMVLLPSVIPASRGRFEGLWYQWVSLYLQLCADLGQSPDHDLFMTVMGTLSRTCDL